LVNPCISATNNGVGNNGITSWVIESALSKF